MAEVVRSEERTVIIGDVKITIDDPNADKIWIIPGNSGSFCKIEDVPDLIKALQTIYDWRQLPQTKGIEE